jgi:hypothetical protein
MITSWALGHAATLCAGCVVCSCPVVASVQRCAVACAASHTPRVVPCLALLLLLLLTVLRLKNHTDAIAAARAFDRAALCLARAAMGSKSPELNFPAEEYEGERLPDLRGEGPALTYAARGPLDHRR